LLNPDHTRKAIDVHGHFGPYDLGAGRLSDGWRGQDIDVVRRWAEAAGIGLTVVSATRALMPYRGDVLRGNDDARAAADRHADVCFWAVLDPRVPESYRQVEELLGHPRCKGIKIHPTLHEYEIREHGDAIFDFAAARRAIVLTHSGGAGSFPEDFVAFANRYPSVALILAHLGNSPDGNMTRQVHAIKGAAAGNLYVDTSSAMSITPGLIEWAVSEIGADHILFGTDSPLYVPACQKARIEYAEIDEAAKRAILYENAARLLGEDLGQSI
jgi:predicted TIM-barrel fold metal-dependent hydrolase